tara:strand:- start:11163 stop:12287 length:1125 start_codon:yes stop_codon:yes gene_type:complete
LNQILIKEVASKSIVWFENSNQYLILENAAAEIVAHLYCDKSIEKITEDLEKKLSIPYEKAIDFVIDINEQIVQPNKLVKPTAVNHSEFTIPSSFEFEKYYKINQKIVKVDFSNEFELSLIHPKFAHLEVEHTENVHFYFQTFNKDNYTYLVLDNELIGSWGKKEIHYFQGKFSMKIIECIYEKIEEKWMGVFHASAINHQENSMLILGDSGNGKSTSLALLQAHGFHCIADDFVPIDDQKNVHAFPAGISIKKNSLPVLLDYYPELNTSAEYHYKRLNKTVRYLPPKDINYKKSYPCVGLIFIKYDANTEFECKEISQLEAFQNLIPDSWISSIPENVTVFLDWFSKLPCYQLTYSKNEFMIEKVKQLFENDL